MKKRVLSALLVLCMACGLVSTAWAADGGQATRETAEKPGIMLLDAEGMDQQTAADPTATPSASPAADPTATPAPTAEPTAEPSATPDATEAPEVTATPAPENSETAENETDTAEPTATPATTPDEAEPVEYTAALEQDGQALNVVVTAPADAFGADVQPTLHVAAIEDETEAKAIEDKLAENNIEYDGFAALDISFTDADGNEIEPSEPVTVRIELPDSIIDSGIDLNTLAVQHFAEDEAGNVTSVDQVASVADNTIVLSDEAKAAMEAQAAEENAANGVAPMMMAPAANNALTADNGEAEETEAPIVAEFEVNGFSKFTITWDGYTTFFNITVRYVDEEGNIISGEETPDYLYNGRTINFADYADKVDTDQYQYVEARYNGFDGHVVTSMQATSSGIMSTSHTITFYNEDEIVPTDNNTWSPGQWPINREIYLVFKDISSGTTPGGQKASVKTGKSADKINGTDNYTLNLSFTGNQGSEDNPAKVDLLLVVDKSGSMEYDLDRENGDDRERMQAVVDAVKTLTGTLVANDQVDVQYDLITFSSLGYTSSDKNTRWTTDANDINDAVSYFTETNRWGGFENSLSGGTNYQYAFSKAKQALNSRDVRSDAQQIVIFLTDGIPTHRGTRNESQDNNNTGYKNTTAATGELTGIKADAFYCIGVGEVFTETERDSPTNGKTNLKRIITKLKELGITTTDEPYAASSTEQLENIFNQIASTTTFFAADQVKLTDQLSQYADIVPDDDGNWHFTVVISGGNGQSQSLPVTIQKNDNTNSGTAEVTFKDSKNQDVKATVSYNDTSKTIQLTLPSEYQLEQGYTYSISTTIKPSAQATDPGDYNGVGENNTGSHAGAAGFRSNNDDNAKVDYRAITTDENGNVTSGREDFTPFPKPVIQVPTPKTGDLKLTKQLAESNYNELVPTDTEFTFTITIPAGDSDANVKSYTAEYTGASEDATLHSGGVTFTKVENTANASATVKLYAGESVTIKGLPTGINPTIKEEETQYSKSWSGTGISTEPAPTDDSITTSAIVAGQIVNVTCTNTLQMGNLGLQKKLFNDIADAQGIYPPIQTNNKFTFKVTAGEDVIAFVKGHRFDSSSVNDNSQIVFNDDGVATIQIGPDKDLSYQVPYGHYTVEEINIPAEITGTDGTSYYFTRSDKKTDPITVNGGSESSNQAAIANYYKPYRTVIITKNVDGEMGDKTKPFNFKVSVKRGATTQAVTIAVKDSQELSFGSEKVTLDLQDADNTPNDKGVYSAAYTSAGFTLGGGDTLTIYKLKDDDTVTIQEMDADQNGYETTYTVNGMTLEGKPAEITIDTDEFASATNNKVSVTVNNKRGVITPTGLESNHTKPYTLMVTAAGVAGLALIGTIVARRVRRRREE